MGLKWKTLSAKDLAAAFQNASAQGKADAFAELEKGTNAMKDLSVKNSPVDTGELEAAHKVVKRRNGSDKVTLDVVVGGVVNGVDVDAYAMRIHEGAWKNLGPKSKIKQAGQSEIVGSKFLERAYNTLIEGIITKIGNVLAKRFDDVGK